MMNAYSPLAQIPQASCLAWALAFTLFTSHAQARSDAPDTNPARLTAGQHTSAPVQARFQAPGFYRFQLGAFEITALSDGTVPQHMDQLMEAKPGQVRRLLEASFQTLPVETSMNAFLIHTGQQLLLVDTGAGSSFGAGVGNHLLRNLRAAGYSAEQIDGVLLTHVHGDHSGGLIDAQGNAVFPNAHLYVAQAELAHWLSEKARAQAAAHHQPMFGAGRAALAPYFKLQRVRAFTPGQTLFPGIGTMASPGHTPGHSFFHIQSNGQTLVIWGDVVHAAEVQFPAPAITIAYDTDPSAASRMRLAAFADAAQHGYWVAAPHIAFPGLGHVRQKAGQFEWVAAPYGLAQ